MKDITITYKPGASQGFVRANTAQGKLWLARNAGSGLRVNGAVMASPTELLALIRSATRKNITINWKLPPSA